MQPELALKLLSEFCTLPEQLNRHAVAKHLLLARISRDYWHKKELTRIRHATHIDFCRIHRRAAELVAQHGQRSETNAYPVTL